MTLIKLKPVYSAPALDMPTVVSCLPSGWSLTWHQAETFKALQNPEVDVVINTAMTGDGKSLAAYLSVLQDGQSVIGLYPTNELARDQEGQVQRYLDLFGQSGQHPIQRLSGPDLELLAESGGVGKAVALETATTQADILLTNPDLFHYLHRGAYLSPWDTPNSLWSRIDQLFNLFVFDEFHVFSAPQIASTLNTLLLIRHTNRAKKFLFLSATPDPQLLNYLTQAGFRVRQIDPQDERKYQFPEDATAAAALQAQGWRSILHAVDLEVVGLESGPLAAEQWLREQVLQIRQYFLDFPGSKGAVILNSVAGVKRLLPDFRALFAEAGLQVEENTGLTGKTTRLKSLQADLVLGTSTIDVGVDFQINFLIFESADAGSFIQRLGRLGRHASYQRDGQQITFTQFRGVALLPRFLQERLFLKEGAVLTDGGCYDRPTLNAAVKNSFQIVNDFRGYYRHWAPLQSFRLWWDLGNPRLGDHYQESREQFAIACERTFGIHPRRMGGRIKTWAEAWKQLSGGQKGNPIFEEAVTFRGSSPLQCGLLDLTEAQAADRFKTYDLPGILTNLEVESLSKAAFLRELQQTVAQTGHGIAQGRFEHCLAFLRVRAYRGQPLRWRFIYAGSLAAAAAAWKVQILVGVGIWQPDNPWIREIDRRLRQQALVSYVVPLPVAEVRQRLYLPMHFAIYGIGDEGSVHTSTPPYSIAFGQAALLLDTLAYRLKPQGGEAWII